MKVGSRRLFKLPAMALASLFIISQAKAEIITKVINMNSYQYSGDTVDVDRKLNLSLNQDLEVLQIKGHATSHRGAKISLVHNGQMVDTIDFDDRQEIKSFSLRNTRVNSQDQLKLKFHSRDGGFFLDDLIAKIEVGRGHPGGGGQQGMPSQTIVINRLVKNSHVNLGQSLRAMGHRVSPNDIHSLIIVASEADRRPMSRLIVLERGRIVSQMLVRDMSRVQKEIFIGDSNLMEISVKAEGIIKLEKIIVKYKRPHGQAQRRHHR